MQVLFIRLIFCGQVYELPKRKTGCNYRKSSELQPVIKIQLLGIIPLLQPAPQPDER